MTLVLDDSGSSFVLFLGTGSSSSTPHLPCLISEGYKSCAACSDAIRNPLSKNIRLNPSLLIHYHNNNNDNDHTSNNNTNTNNASTNNNNTNTTNNNSTTGGTVVNVLIDCGKTFREGVLRWFLENKVRCIDALILTHDHADACGGLDDMRDVQNGTRPLPIYANEATHASLRQKFPYLFPGSTSDAFIVRRRIANVTQEVICENVPFDVRGLMVTPLRLLHGGDYVCYGFSFGNPDHIVYLSDFLEIPSSTFSTIIQRCNNKIKILVLDLLRDLPHPAHSNFAQSVEVAKQFLQQTKIEFVYFLGICHEVEHEEANRRLTEIFRDYGSVVELAYDGLKIPVDVVGE